MILRRVIEHFRKQEWTAIGLDFLIVVMGVFIGTQVSNWNDARAARERGKAFSERLLNDVRDEARGYQNQISYYKEVLANAEKAINALSGAATTDQELLVSAYRASQYLYLTRHRAVYDELVSTGTIGLVADRKLRETAILLYTTTNLDDIREAAMKSEYRVVFRRTIPAAVQRELLAKCGDNGSDRVGWTLDYACALDLPPGAISDAANALRDQPSALASLQLRFADLESAVFNLEFGESVLRDGLQDLEETAP